MTQRLARRIICPVAIALGSFLRIVLSSSVAALLDSRAIGGGIHSRAEAGDILDLRKRVRDDASQQPIRKMCAIRSTRASAVRHPL